MSNKFIPVNTPLFSGNELTYLTECITTGWISSEGPFVSQFEESFSTYVDRKHGIAVSNGSAALDIAVKALNIGAGDEVIVPTFTIISPVQSIIYAGANPVLVDCDVNTWNINVERIEEKINEHTKAILIVHIYGLPVDMDPVLDLCKKYNLKLIEDAAEVHGQTYKNRMCGSFGDISTFSFYPNKHITTGEGGMIVCNDEEISERCKKLRNLAFEPKGRRFIHHELGWNYRVTNMQAALGLAQLEKINEHIQRKREIGKLYQEGLKGIKGFQLPLDGVDYAENIYWVFGMVADSQELADSTVAYLAKNLVGTRPFFWCMHEQPVFQKMNLFLGEHYPVSEKIARNGFYLPSGLGMTDEDVSVVINLLQSMP